jgi:hypothetical protein
MRSRSRLLRIALLTALCAPTISLAQGAESKRPPRILGVFDARDGLPIPDVQIIDLVGDVSAQTSSTGTVS